MGQKQAAFLKTFQSTFIERFCQNPAWIGGQVSSNKALLASRSEYRRTGTANANEGIELGDLRGTFRGHTVIVEHESDAISVQNLVKYWAYLRGELSIRPTSPVVICHFSNWNSYGSFRDLWCWLRDQMAGDPRLIVPFAAEQFDHGGGEPASTVTSIGRCLEYLSASLSAPCDCGT
jgi:hypothetical protein